MGAGASKWWLQTRSFIQSSRFKGANNRKKWSIWGGFCLMHSKFHCDMLKKFGTNCICIDSTHSTNYHFPLTTLMVIDEFGEGVPVAYMISNHETGAVIETFYDCIKSRVGVLEPLVFVRWCPLVFRIMASVSGEVLALKSCVTGI